jgi:hypothetical protein
MRHVQVVQARRRGLDRPAVADPLEVPAEVEHRPIILDGACLDPSPRRRNVLP